MRWTFKDYPVDYIDQGYIDVFKSVRFTHHRWRADLLGLMYLSGLGDDRASALADARVKFDEYLVGGGKLSRPGSRVQVAFASSVAVNLYPDLQQHFVNTILKLPWAWLSDESSLWDFHGELDNSALEEQIWHVYGVDVTHIKDGNIARILQTIMEETGDFPEDEIHRSIRMCRDERDRRVAMLPIPKWIQDEDDEQYSSNQIGH